MCVHKEKKEVFFSKTKYELTDSFSIALSFAYAALYGALPTELQRQFSFATSLVGETKRIVGMYGSGAINDRVTDKNWDRTRQINLVLDNGIAVSVFIKQKFNGDGTKNQWRVVGLSYQLKEDDVHVVVVEPFNYFGTMLQKSIQLSVGM